MGRLSAQRYLEHELIYPYPVSSMENSGRKKKKKFKVNPKKIILLVAVLYLFFNILQLHMTIWDLNKQIEEGIQKKQELLAEQKELREEIERVKSTEYVEKLAREQLGLVKPGENLVVHREDLDD
ncbi:MAG: septum formation initiator family protein [Clostridia bacterium]|nr:septum formation initiator family protein [Clostridia bacterium]